jgi:hypothetical protein
MLLFNENGGYVTMKVLKLRIKTILFVTSNLMMDLARLGRSVFRNLS